MPRDDDRLNKSRNPGSVVDMDPHRAGERVDPRKSMLGIDHMVAASKQIAKMVEPVRLTNEEMDAHKIIYPEMRDRKTIDLYRELRTKLVENSPNDNPITLVCSVTPQGGATHLALNLAVSYSLDASKTALLIDCNLANPSLDERLYLDPEYGLTDFLENEVVSIDNIIYATGIPRLRLIPVGHKRGVTSEFFTSLRMKAFLDVVKRRYPDRHIFIDAPSVASSVDARILSILCDRVVLCVQYGRVTETQVRAAMEALGEEKIAGIILNN